MIYLCFKMLHIAPVRDCTTAATGVRVQWLQFLTQHGDINLSVFFLLGIDCSIRQLFWDRVSNWISLICVTRKRLIRDFLCYLDWVEPEESPQFTYRHLSYHLSMVLLFCKWQGFCFTTCTLLFTNGLSITMNSAVDYFLIAAPGKGGH